ncbi:C6 finger domain protein, partial [Aspergillus sclerotialis]
MQSSESPDSTQGHNEQGPTSQRKKMQKMRPYFACIPCRNRKVKCDRLTPCDTCTSRGISHECKYIANDSDRFQMSQAEKISELRSVVRELRNRVVKAEEEERRRKAGTFFNPNPNTNASFSGQGDPE